MLRRVDEIDVELPTEPTLGDLFRAMALCWGLEVALMVPFLIATHSLDDPAMALEWVPIDGVITLFCCWVFACRKHRRPIRAGFSLLRPSGRAVALGAVLGFALGAIVLAFSSGAPSTGTFMGRAIVAITRRPGGSNNSFAGGHFAPVFEELYYRGFAFDVLARRWNAWVAGLVTVTWFTLLHVPQLADSATRLVFIAALSVLCTLLRALTRSSVPGLVAHVVYNACVLSPLLFASTRPE